MSNIFKIRREERWIALAALLVITALNALLFVKYGDIITRAHHVSYWNIFGRTFHVSGFDDWSYIYLSNSKIYYVLSRHPLFGVVLAPFYHLNKWAMDHGDINYAYFIMAVSLIFCAFYSFVFLYRTLHDILELRRTDATILSALFFSFGMIMVTSMVPDHFCWSMFLLMLTLYVTGRKLKHGTQFTVLQTFLLAFFTAGITLSNVVKTYVAVAWTNGLRFFSLRRSMVVVVLPLALLGALFSYQYYEMLLPQKVEDKHIEQVTLAKNKSLAQRNMAHHLKVTAKIPKPISDKPFIGWIDLTTNRVDAFVENMFGESVQLHDSYLLEDIYENRPEVVRYSHTYYYMVEALLLLLMAWGIARGWRHRLLQVALSWFAIDLMLHFVLGFGLNEIYIMAAHWMMVIPLSLAFIVRGAEGRRLVVGRSLLLLLTLYLWISNGSLLVQFMSDPVTQIFK